LPGPGRASTTPNPSDSPRLGYLAARKELGKTRERTIYTLTGRGLDALRAYAATPVTFTPLKSEPLLRLLICDLVGEEVTRESMATLRADIADIQRRLDDAESRAGQLPHREKYLLLVSGFLRGLLDLHGELIDQVEQELHAEPVSAPARSADGMPR